MLAGVKGTTLSSIERVYSHPQGLMHIRVTEANASDVLGNKTISYQASAHTLTLNGANLTTPMKAGKYIYGIR